MESNDASDAGAAKRDRAEAGDEVVDDDLLELWELRDGHRDWARHGHC
ncbi:MAG: hypothetical protein U0Q16_12960 [Bryobacteraceae bacterium]